MGEGKLFDGTFKFYREREQAIFNSLYQELSEHSELLFAGDMLKRAYEKFPDQPALIYHDTTLTYRAFYARACKLARVFQSHGVRAGDRVLISYENSVEFYIAYFAAWMLHAVVTPVNIFLHQRELGFIIKDALPKLLFVMESTEKKFVTLVQSLFLSVNPTILTGRVIADDQSSSIEQIIPDKTLKSDDLCLLLYTSGTTGSPKGVMLSSRNILTNTMQSYARFSNIGNMRDGERFFCVLPLFHVFAQNTCIWLPIIAGSSVIIVPKIDRKLILKGLEKKPTMFLGFPALYGLLCLMRTAPLESVKMFVSGADMLPDKIRLAFGMIYGRKICAGYGLTEAAPVVSVNHLNQERPSHVVGHPVVGITCQIRDEHGNILPQGIVGTVWIKGDNIMLGYYHASDPTQAVLVDGWLNTGDLGTIDEQGMLAICGRSKDIIIHKGFNIYPQEIENILMTHPNVYKAAVVGKEEDTSGEIPVAFVALRSYDAAVEDDLRKWCADNLAAYKVPRKFICLEDLPMNATGKVDKKLLKQERIT